MKLQSYAFQLFIVSLLLLISSPFWVWQLKNERSLNLLIIDKTVPDETYREHKGLVWILNQQKYLNKDGSQYELSEDYAGFVPGEGSHFTIKELPSAYDHYDAVYVADTYGVYEEEFFKREAAGNRSNKLYGGLNQEDIDGLTRAAHEGKSLIAEFNSMAQPTTEEMRRKFNELFQIKWTGWIGRYFEDLDSSEVPPWVRENYKRQNDQSYSFSGPGYVFVDQADSLLILDENDIDGNGVLFTTTSAGERLFDQTIQVTYSYWFDIVNPVDSEDVAANFTLSLTIIGKEKLKAHRLPETFPAVIHSDNQQADTYYFSGDFADHPDVPDIYQTSGLTTWRKWTSNQDDAGGFYWKAYVPMMEKILSTIEKEN
jgi:hypothetical protein